ncbi:reverse transcriptase domain-containing protein [Morganella psychrotolerans]|uniref:RNA-dependent DNA polymerase n=1 Tax=Morganella psychrotolerans TaxID=368603 RepID=A0A1B8HQJ1_9GAMM|nr:reverse transcriptase domain-containing protein [Morganella psychrotolerans]OBU11746.1 RNA-dependent DNA polymerase [Morganella psychrotolerans]
MKLFDEFSDFFSLDNLREIYNSHIILSASTGIDNMNHKVLWRMLDEQLAIVNRKVLSSGYTFSKYKLKLISKGQGKAPREISIPTIRDKIALRALCNFLKYKYSDVLTFDLPQNIIKDVKENILLNKYDSFIKLDVTNFYPSIKHEKLISTLRMRLRNKNIISLIDSAIKSPTVSHSKKTDVYSMRGVPQGLSISNILAAIYLSNIDKKFNKVSDIKYYRYVDDILILCNAEVIEDITKELGSRFNKLGLKIHKRERNSDKSTSGSLLCDKFNYLGYSFFNDVVSARSGSVDKLRESLLAIFTSHKHSKFENINFLEWRINLRVTGCIFQNKSKGWMYFFSEIENEILLHQLDSFVAKLCKRFSVKLNIKSFVRTFYQIKHNRRETKYIPNFDNYNIKEMTRVLNHYFKKDTKKLTDIEIEYHFKKRISNQVKDLETDIKDAGY